MSCFFLFALAAPDAARVVFTTIHNGLSFLFPKEKESFFYLKIRSALFPKEIKILLSVSPTH